jgi:hypothetical protein
LNHGTAPGAGGVRECNNRYIWGKWQGLVEDEIKWGLGRVEKICVNLIRKLARGDPVGLYTENIIYFLSLVVVNLLIVNLYP